MAAVFTLKRKSPEHNWTTYFVQTSEYVEAFKGVSPLKFWKTRFRDNG